MPPLRVHPDQDDPWSVWSRTARTALRRWVIAPMSGPTSAPTVAPITVITAIGLRWVHSSPPPAMDRYRLMAKNNPPPNAAPFAVQRPVTFNLRWTLHPQVVGQVLSCVGSLCRPASLQR